MKTYLLIKTIVAINVLVTLGWFFSHDNGFFPWMVENFLVSWSALVEGRPWVLVTSAFSHSSILHLMVNMFVLRSFGGVIVQVLGTRGFLNFYILAGVSGSFMHALVSLLFLDNPDLPALGASGAIAGIILLFSFTFPQDKLLLLGLIPVKAKWGSLLIVGLDVWGLVEQAKGGGLPIGHGAHLGGALMGVIWFFWMRNKRAQVNGIF